MNTETGCTMSQFRHFIDEKLFQRPELIESRDSLAIVLAGSRTVGYHTSTSDYDLLGLCDTSTYARILRNTDHDPSVAGIDISIDQKEAEEILGGEVDFAIYEAGRIQAAFQEYNDVILWIWIHAQAIVDPCHTVSELQESFDDYPRDVLERKLKQHFLQDFNLSVHGLTYRPESRNIFSVLNAMTSKMGEYCKMSCLLDGKPFPYDKWLLRACADTQLGEQFVPIFERVLSTLSSLQNDLPGQWPMVREAIDAIDTEACDALENALISWGISKAWLDHSYHELHTVLFGSS